MELDRVFVRVTSGQLEATLVAVTSRLEGFSIDAIRHLCADVAALEADDDVLIEHTISFRGHALPIIVDVFKDTHGALEVVFLVPPVLTSLVHDVAGAVVGAAAVRRMRATRRPEGE